MITQEEKRNIVDKLLSIINDREITCPMCGNKHFSIGDGYFVTSIQDNLKDIQIGGEVIPSIPIICNKCGFISLHALGALGLLPKKNGGKDGK